MKFIKNIFLAILISVSSLSFAQTEQKTPEVNVTVLPSSVEGWWVNLTTNNTQKFEFAKIKIFGNQVTGEFTIWSSGSSNCNLIKAPVSGTVEGDILTFSVPAKCLNNYVATFNFKEKSGSYKGDNVTGVYKYSF